MVLAEWAGNESGSTCRYFIDSMYQCCGLLWLQAKVSEFLCQTSHDAQCGCVKPGITGVYIEHEAAASRSARACRMHGLSQGPGPLPFSPSDLTQP